MTTPTTIPLPRPGSLGLIQYAGVDMLEYAAAVSAAKDAEIAQLRAARMAYASEFPLNADGEPDVGNIHANIRAMKERVRVLEDALRHVDDCLSINDYGDYALLPRFDSDIVSAALEQKP